jgi:hypothetical protein
MVLFYNIGPDKTIPNTAVIYCHILTREKGGTVRKEFLSSGLYYKLIMIVIDAASVTLQIVASLMSVIDDTS